MLVSWVAWGTAMGDSCPKRRSAPGKPSTAFPGFTPESHSWENSVYVKPSTKYFVLVCLTEEAKFSPTWRSGGALEGQAGVGCSSQQGD